MRFAKTSSLISLFATALLASAAPHRKRAAATDILVYQFADVLEQFESAFYAQALSQFQASDFTSAGFSSSELAIEQLTVIQTDEATHSTVLQAAIKSFGATPITSCQFDFSSAMKDVTTMAATARIIESVGVSAYLGGAALVSDPVLLTSAASILTVEARHQTILNILSSTGTAIPNAFDFALTPSEVLALASPFFKGACDLGVPVNPVLSVTNTGSIAVGTQLSFSSPAINSSTDTSKFYCQMLLGGQPTSIPFPFNSCVVPPGINGPVAIFITSDGQPLINNVVDRATTQLVAGPLLTFIDTQPQKLGEAVGIASGSSSGSSSSGSSTDSSGSSTDSSGSSAATPTATDSSVGATDSATTSSGSSAATPSATDSSASATGSATTSSGSSAATPTATDSSASATGSASTSTETISPAEASIVIAGASSSATANAMTPTASSASSPTPASSASAASGSPNVFIAVPGGPNTYVGPAAGGTLIIKGWNYVPNPHKA
ncbi:hypothetical protein BYT27DRAFT_7252377 [Phlegmacium glaucopus]|nr:hypothetical protein BYT27DRAFT_7252377 [Phlegmacium glaucopus]